MLSEYISRDTAEQLEKILHEISKEEDSSIRRSMRDKILPLYKEAVSNSGGLYDSQMEIHILGQINEDDWTY